MNTQLQTSEPVETLQQDNIEVTAVSPNEMVQSNASLIVWCARRIKATQDQANELESAYRSAVEKKWASAALKKHWQLAVKRVQFFEKIKAALEAGFYIVPSFPVQLFAIRTGKNKPKYHLGTYSHPRVQDGYFHEKAQILPAGEGEYVSETPEVKRVDVSYTKAEKTIEQYNYLGDEFKDVEFPINMAKPRIMELTDRAMALKVFDEFGVLPEAKRKVDPMIVGHIIDPRSGPYNKKVVTFIIAWHLNTAVL